VATFRPFRLPGGERAIQEPRRAALGLLAELWGEALWEQHDLAPLKAFTPAERARLRRMIARAVHSPLTSSAGRLFDAVASLLELRQQAGFEGQAAMALEFAINGERTDDAYPFRVAGGETMIVDWGPMIEAILAERGRGGRLSSMAAGFHNTLAEIVVAVAERVGQERVVLTGGCFQNRYLTERTVGRLRRQGIRPYWHQRLPPNDGAIALGQLAVAAAIPGEGDDVSGGSR
jgi:hydrogenase maturation protein HypF